MIKKWMKSQRTGKMIMRMIKEIKEDTSKCLSKFFKKLNKN
jgi:hypothetical protein